MYQYQNEKLSYASHNTLGICFKCIVAVHSGDPRRQNDRKVVYSDLGVGAAKISHQPRRLNGVGLGWLTCHISVVLGTQSQRRCTK